MTERLDRIERMLEVLASNQVAERESRLADVDILYDLARQTGERLDRLAERVDGLTIRMNDLSQLMAQSIETANADRAIMRENQVEIRRIWEYLMRQSPNGHGEAI